MRALSVVLLAVVAVAEDVTFRSPEGHIYPASTAPLNREDLEPDSYHIDDAYSVHRSLGAAAEVHTRALLAGVQESTAHSGSGVHAAGHSGVAVTAYDDTVSAANYNGVSKAIHSGELVKSVPNRVHVYSHSYSVVPGSAADGVSASHYSYNGVYPSVYNGVPATSYNEVPVTTYNGIPDATYNGVPVSTHNGVPVSTYNGVPLIPYYGVPSYHQGVPFFGYTAAQLSALHSAGGYSVAPTPGEVGSDVYDGYSLGSFPVDVSQNADY